MCVLSACNVRPIRLWTISKTTTCMHSAQAPLVLGLLRGHHTLQDLDDTAYVVAACIQEPEQACISWTCEALRAGRYLHCLSARLTGRYCQTAARNPVPPCLTRVGFPGLKIALALVQQGAWSTLRAHCCMRGVAHTPRFARLTGVRAKNL
jgi:hypothetical protein